VSPPVYTPRRSHRPLLAAPGKIPSVHPMSPSSHTRMSTLGATIAHEDLALLAEVAMMRFPLRAAESHRLERMRTLLEAASDLTRTLEAYTHSTLVNYRGSHGTGDLVADSATLGVALHRFGQIVGETAAAYRRAGRGAMPDEMLPIPVATELGAGVAVR
jgi:hypothetical protein